MTFDDIIAVNNANMWLLAERGWQLSQMEPVYVTDILDQ